MSYFGAFVLAVVQAVTEFLPVSSSGHLVVSQYLLGFREPMIAFDVMLHVGSLVAVLVYYRRRVLEMAVSLVSPARSPAGRRLVLLIVVASVPTAVMGLGFGGFVREVFASPAGVGMFWILTAGLLFGVSRLAHGEKTIEQMTIADALLIGLFQGVAILPGVSRSGATLVMGIMCGLHPKQAADFSFLIFIPAMLGATLLQYQDLMAMGASELNVCIVGAVVTAVFSYAAIWFLLRLLQRRVIIPFAWYCLAAGAATLAIVTLRP